MTGSEIVAATSMIAGSLLVLVGAIGIQRFDDAFARMHAATKPVTLGLVLVLAGAGVQLAATSAVAELALAAVFQIVSAPVGMQLVARAAYDSGTEMSSATAIDELAPDAPGRRGPG